MYHHPYFKVLFNKSQPFHFCHDNYVYCTPSLVRMCVGPLRLQRIFTNLTNEDVGLGLPLLPALALPRVIENSPNNVSRAVVNPLGQSVGLA